MIVQVVGNFKGLAALLHQVGEEQLPGLAEAVMQAANYAQLEWVKAIRAAKTPSGWKDLYADSIRITPTSSALAVDVQTDSKYASFVEDGIKRFDMKPGLLKGRNFVRIPFRHFTSSARGNSNKINQIVYAAASKLKKGESLSGSKWQNLGRYSRIITVRGKLAQKNMAETKAGKYEGLQKMGSKGHSQYMTFRTVSKRSVGWIHPGVPKSPVFSVMSRAVQPGIQKILSEGLMMDVKRGLEYRLSKVNK